MLGIISVLLIFFIFLYKGCGGGLFDMFGGGMMFVVGLFGFVEWNLNCFIVVLVLMWFVFIVVLGFIMKFEVI